MGNGAFGAAWLLGMSIVIYRDVQQNHRMPVPGALVGVTGFFAALALVGDVVPSARPVTALLAWGLDLAGLMKLLNDGLSGQISQAESSQAKAEGLS